MGNIAAYQEGYTDGAHDQKCNVKNKIKEFINLRYYSVSSVYNQGYNAALKDIADYIEVL